MSRYLLRRFLSLPLGATVLLSGCSPTSSISPEIFTGTALGTAAGSSVGWIFSREYGNTAQNLLVNGAIGAGVGLLAGTLLHERNVKLAQERQVVIREAEVIDESQKEIDQLREKVYDSSSWGRNETKSFDRRYQTEESEAPYQGAPTFY